MIESGVKCVMTSGQGKSEGKRKMRTTHEASWLVDVFLEYQGVLDKLRETGGGQKLWLKEALESDRREKCDDQSLVGSADQL